MKAFQMSQVVLVEYGSGKGGLANAVLRQEPNMDVGCERLTYMSHSSHTKQRGINMNKH